MSFWNKTTKILLDIQNVIGKVHYLKEESQDRPQNKIAHSKFGINKLSSSWKSYALSRAIDSTLKEPCNLDMNEANEDKGWINPRVKHAKQSEFRL